MKVTINWLKKYVDFHWGVHELADRLTMVGVEVESIQQVGASMDGVVVAQILTREPHPKADRLSVCRVFDGERERQIVCGATNFRPGDKAPLILPGYRLPCSTADNPLVIKEAQIRGVLSQGMLCSEKELGLSDEAEGIMILPQDAPVGMPLARYLGRDEIDYVLDLEITPNRPDLNSVIGVAREIAAIAHTSLRIPEIRLNESDQFHTARLVGVQIEDPNLCFRYIARIVLGAKVGRSPMWLRWTLEKVGLRSINNIVDVTNFVLLECGQPLHAFDYRLLGKGQNGLPEIVVRRARAGETIVTLDGVTRQLSGDDLLIADPEKPIALAGIMGGANSEIRETTVDVLIESACFDPISIRRAARRHNLHTEASYRFERGVDLQTVEWASARCVQLIRELTGGVVARGAVDIFPKPRPKVFIQLRYGKVADVLGIDLQPEQIDSYLGRLQICKVACLSDQATAEQSAGVATFEVPSFRLDLHQEADLIEEVCRLHGVERILPAEPLAKVGRHPFDEVYDQLQQARQILSGFGLVECQGQSLIAREAALLTSSERELILLERPLSSDMNVLRPSLLPGLLDIVRHNHNHQNYDLALFEIGRVFKLVDEKPVEKRHLAIALMGRRYPSFWQSETAKAAFDVFDLKGLIEAFAQRFCLPPLRYVRRQEPASLFAESAEVWLEETGRVVGQLGQVSPSVLQRYDLRFPVFLAELDLEELMTRRAVKVRFKPLPLYPSVRRDVALVVPETVTNEQVLEAIQSAGNPLIESVELFDVYRGPNIRPGFKSMAYSIRYRASDRTLRDSEVNAAHEALIRLLEDKLRVQVRGC